MKMVVRAKQSRLLLVLVVCACGGSQTPLPKGPPPQYEDEPGMTEPEASTPAPSADAGAD